jgi:hypothetical protein
MKAEKMNKEQMGKVRNKSKMAVYTSAIWIIILSVHDVNTLVKWQRLIISNLKQNLITCYYNRHTLNQRNSFGESKRIEKVMLWRQSSND